MAENAPDVEPAAAVPLAGARPRTASRRPPVPRPAEGPGGDFRPMPKREPLRGQPLSNAELAAIDVEDLKSEEKPVVDNDEQQLAMGHTGDVLRARFGRDTSVHVDMGLYYLPRDERGDLPCEEGDQRTPTRYAPYVVPDVMVAFGVPRERYRSSYQTWRMGKAPDFVLEVASRSTWRRDYGAKRELYERLGVAEYMIFDARLTPVRKRLTAYRLNAEGRYEEVGPTVHEGLGPGIRSELVGLVAFVDAGNDLGWWDPDRKERLRQYEESERDRQRERDKREKAERALAASEAGRERERMQREQAERELAELQAKLAALQDTPDAH